MNQKVVQEGDAEVRNDLVSLESIEDDDFGAHVFDEEGQLTVDIYQTEDAMVVVAPVAGVSPDEIDITVSDQEVLTIRGSRSFHKSVHSDDYITKECFWGAFSRSIVLPDGLDVDEISASFNRGVLTVTIPKIKIEKVKKIKIRG